MADILYTFENKVYVNITNACPCSCNFCIRNNGNSVGEAETLWFDAHHMPSYAEIEAAIKAWDFEGYKDDVVFCGYGEPTCAYENLIKAAKLLKSMGLKTRLNTNGLSDLINKKETAKELCEVMDTISISLNAPTAEKYEALCHPAFGLKSYDAILKFAEDCKQYNVNLKFTVVDVISEEDIEDCRKIAKDMGIAYRVREYSAD